MSRRVGLRPTRISATVAVMPTTQDIAKRIRSLIAEKRISQKSIAEALHLSPSSFGKRVNGQRQISATEICGIAKALGVKAGDLLD